MDFSWITFLWHHIARAVDWVFCGIVVVLLLLVVADYSSADFTADNLTTVPYRPIEH